MELIPTDPKKAEPLPANAPRWLKLVPMLTGVLAGVGGYLTIRSTNLSNEAIYWSTQATLKQDLATNKWAQYQAESIKARMGETQRLIAPANAPYLATLDEQDKTFRQMEPELKKQAQALESQRDEDLKGGLERLKQKDLLGYAGMAVQVGIALASVAALVRNPMAFYAAVFCGVVGVGMVGYVLLLAYMH